MKEIGGSRYIDISTISDVSKYNEKDLNVLMQKNGFSGIDYLFLSSGRSAESFILDNMEDKRKIAIVPAFTCETVILPLYQRNYDIYYYHISQDYEIDCIDLENKIRSYSPSLVLYHSIYGFSSRQGIRLIIQKYSESGIIFVEDRTMDWFMTKNIADGVHYTIGSFRKWFAVPDGGFIYSTNSVLRNKPTIHDKELESKKIDAYNKMFLYRVWNMGSFRLCKQNCSLAEECLEQEKQYFRMSPMSINITCSTNMKQIVKQRRENYNYLYNHLSGLSELVILSPKLDNEIVPFHFVVSSIRKRKLIEHLYSCDIYPSNVWETLNYFPNIEVNEFERFLYKSAFFLEIDQMYSLQDMERIVNAIHEGIKF